MVSTYISLGVLLLSTRAKTRVLLFVLRLRVPTFALVGVLILIFTTNVSFIDFNKTAQLIKYRVL